MDGSPREVTSPDGTDGPRDDPASTKGLSALADRLELLESHASSAQEVTALDIFHQRLRKPVFLVAEVSDDT